VQKQNKPAFLTLCSVALALLAGLLLTINGLASSVVRAQTDAESGISAPAPGSTVTDTVSIEGTAANPSFQRYELYAKPADASDEAYVYIGGGDTQVIASQLGVWDTTDLEPGLYDLRMRVVRLDGNYNEYVVSDLQIGPAADAPPAVITATVTPLPPQPITAPATAAATATISPTVAPTDETAEPSDLPAEAAQILVESDINVRAGPGTDYPVIGALAPGQRAGVTGQNAAGDWWQLAVDGGSGWVLGRLVTAENVADVPTVEAPALPSTPVPATETPVVAATPVATATNGAGEEVAPAAPETDAVVLEEVAAPGAISAGGPMTVTLTGDVADAAALRTFLRLQLAGVSPSNTMVTATIGALPANLPLTLTVPPTATVIGGVVRTGEFGGSQLFLAAAEADDLQTALRQQLLDAGFTTPEDDAPGSGPGQVFLSGDMGTPSLFFCAPDDAYSVNLGAATVAGEPGVVSLNVTPVSQFGGPCGETMGRGDADRFDVLPSLIPPPAAQVRAGGGGSSGPDSFTVAAEAEIESELSVAELAAHYEEQLGAGGWERLDESQTEAVAWSAWSFVDEEDTAWSATFYIVRQGGEADSYLATLRAESQQ